MGLTALSDHDQEYIKLLAREIAFAVFREAMPGQCARCVPTKELAKIKHLLMGIGIGIPIGTGGIIAAILKIAGAL